MKKNFHIKKKKILVSLPLDMIEFINKECAETGKTQSDVILESLIRMKMKKG